ncbi:MAG: hypothetical protein RR540_04715 [Oscillospiraceae bacterium]
MKKLKTGLSILLDVVMFYLISIFAMRIITMRMPFLFNPIYLMILLVILYCGIKNHKNLSFKNIFKFTRKEVVVLVIGAILAVFSTTIVNLVCDFILPGYALWDDPTEPSQPLIRFILFSPSTMRGMIATSGWYMIITSLLYKKSSEKAAKSMPSPEQPIVSQQ